MIKQWVPFEEGEYIVVRAFLLTPDYHALEIEKSFIEVWKDRQGIRQVKGSGMISPFLMVELHEEHEHIDLIIDLGGEFRYRMQKPELQAGKVFSPDVSSRLQFSPSLPWEQISEKDFRDMAENLKFL
ncbi:MAG: hypothetical protein V2I97_10445 [Desulfococcaceae bacterium]|jgi:hypothetical protein|nr:hypothetical protein [Desulfococcaceae bacterium]